MSVSRWAAVACFGALAVSMVGCKVVGKGAQVVNGKMSFVVVEAEGGG